MSLRDYFTQSLKKDEAIVAIVRKHWVTLLVPVIVTIVVLGLLIGFVDFFFRAPVGTGIWFGLVGATLLYGTYHWVIHFFDSFIITDLRIIDIDQTGLFKRTVSETTFDKVQDVTYSVLGLFATTLDYGAVSVQTASRDGKIELDHVPHPRKVQEIITEAQKLFKQRHGGDMSATELINLVSQAKLKNQAGETAVNPDEPSDGPQGDDSDGAKDEE